MSLRKKAIDGTMYDVISIEEYLRNMPLYTQFIAITVGDGYVYPIRTRYDNRPGVRNVPGVYIITGIMYFVRPTTPREMQEYAEIDMIDFTITENMRDYIQTRQRLANAERSILTSIDNVFMPEISENDTPEMIALKEAIRAKGIDLDKYEPRFGPNYNNDKRLLKKTSVTFGKLRSICNALDMKATIKFEDVNPDVPNPIGRIITAELTGDSMSIEED